MLFITRLKYIFLFIDIDECSNGNACGEKAYCVNNDGSFWCLCDPGYNGDPFKKCEGKKWPFCVQAAERFGK